MANLKIKNAPLIPNDQLESSIKIPTGGKGNYSVNLGQIAQFTKNSLSLAVQADVDRLFNEKADKSNTYTKLEVDERISLGQGGVYGFKTYTDFLLVKDNIPANSIVTILEEGQYQGDNVWDGQVLTPSPYDPLAQSKEYTDSKLLDKADKVNVYLKSETFNQQEVQDLVSSSQMSINNRIDTEIIQHGAALPFDESVNYTDKAIVVKDGHLQQLIDGSWIRILPDDVVTSIGGEVGDVSTEAVGGLLDARGYDAQFVKDESGLSQQQINNVVTKFVVSNSELLAIENPSEGWVYRVLETGSMYQFDPSQIAVNNGGTILNGWVAVGLKYVTPEMFGADPTGVTSSRVSIKLMLDSLSEGGVIECKPNAIYYNDAPNGTPDTWVINQNKTYIIANGATFKRRPTATGTASIDHDLASLKVTGKNVTIEGKVYFDGSEAFASIVNSSDTVLATGDYARGYASSHGLHLFGADYFTALQVDSSNAVFNIFADGCVGLNIKGRCKSSGQVYPVTGVDLNLGSGIKLSYCTDYDIDLYTEYAGYCGVEVEPACRFGRVNSVARWASHHGVSFHGDCEGSTVSSVAENCQLGASLRLGAGSRQINGTFSAKDSYLGLWVEPSSTDSTIEGDVTLCNIIGTSMNCKNGSTLLSNNASGGKLRESTIKVRSRSDGNGTTQAFTLENAYECSFDLGVKTAKSALAVNKVHDSEIHMAYMDGITDSNPMFFTADNSVDLTCKIGTSMYRLHRTEGVVEASSLITSASAIPISNYFAFDIHASNLVLPTIATSSAGTVTNALWMDTSASNAIKRKTT